jgi:NAD(P)-dependent dehydrogenase (short-subunit alcohol dehydrogenase family)
VASFAAKFDGSLDLFIANAGTNHPMEGKTADDARGWQTMMMVNAIAPYMLGKSLLPRMADGGKMIAISSGMGSIGDIGGGWVPYRTSKAALNMAWSALALEAKPRGVACVLFSPGWVKTRLGGSGAAASWPPRYSGKSSLSISEPPLTSRWQCMIRPSSVGTRWSSRAPKARV